MNPEQNGMATTPSQKPHWKNFKLVALIAVPMVVVISCVTVQRTVLAPPQIPGATFVGSQSCAECHENITKDFPTSTHARIKAAGVNGAEIGCESCHGPGSLHNESGGALHTIVNPDRSPDICFQCHLDKKGEFNLPHRHPVVEGKMSCTDCHDPHKGHASATLTSMHSQNDNCAKCHTAQHGPFVFEHEAVREGCTVCHAVHGSVNPKMLLQRNASLCLKCHFQQQAGGRVLIGGRDHSAFLSRGTCWTAGCHEAVHGSQIGSSLRF